MNHLRYATLGILATLCLALGCAKPSVNVHRSEIVIGKTRVADLARAKDRALIGLLDRTQSTVYVSETAREQVKRLFQVKQDEGTAWVVDFPERKGRYTVKSLAEVPADRTVIEGDVLANSKYYCEV
ncbi:MAG: hypothetical protein ACRD2R_02365, partial [Terriglobales bacterium]